MNFSVASRENDRIYIYHINIQRCIFVIIAHFVFSYVSVFLCKFLYTAVDAFSLLQVNDLPISTSIENHSSTYTEKTHFKHMQNLIRLYINPFFGGVFYSCLYFFIDFIGMTGCDTQPEGHIYKMLSY